MEITTSRPLNDLTGQRFGRLLVQVYEPRASLGSVWHCLCDCGGAKLAKASHLRRGSTSSCGCLSPKSRRDELLGVRFGMLLVLERVQRVGKGGAVLKCLCDCGNEHLVRATNLRAGGTNSCGCQGFRTKENDRDRAKAWRANNTREKQMFASAKWRARVAGVPFEITLEHIQIPAQCPVLGIELLHSPGKAGPNSPSLDRLTPCLGYVPGNVRVISHRANSLKSDGSLAEMRAIVSYMAQHLTE
jgi:hypothetical protein